MWLKTLTAGDCRGKMSKVPEERLSKQSSGSKTGFAMIIWLNVIIVVIVVVYFLTQQRRTKETWQRFRERKMGRKRTTPVDQPDPIFQFDQLDAKVEKEKPT
jgi:hypothetical protein